MKRINKTKRLTIGVVVCMLIVMLTGTALAKQSTEYISITYRDIKIRLDGWPVAPKDANGNTVEPFIYDGTTYLPLRAVADALGIKGIKWDSGTSTAQLTTYVPGTLSYYRTPSNVPDFGVYLGVPLVASTDVESLFIYVYSYYTLTSDMINSYCRLIQDNGFKYVNEIEYEDGTYAVGFMKGDTLVIVMDTMDYHISIGATMNPDLLSAETLFSTAANELKESANTEEVSAFSFDITD